MAQKIRNIFGILTESIGLYFSEFDKFLKYMTYPILGQLLGLTIIFGTTYFYVQNMPKLMDKYPNLNDFGTVLIILLLITLPGFLLFCNAFWKYLIAYGALNSMFDNLHKSKKVYDFEAHNEVITRRTLSFIGLWFILGAISIIAICPLFSVLCAIFAVYFVLSFQVFTFEPELSPLGCLRKSLTLIKGHFAQTFMLICLIGLITYFLLPQIVIKAFDATGIITALSNALIPFMNIIPEINLSEYGLISITHADYAIITVQSVIVNIIILYTLPMRSILWSDWYMELNGGISSQDITSNSKRKKSKTHPSEKLMEESHKKYSKKKIDNNILKRAMEKDDEDD